MTLDKICLFKRRATVERTAAFDLKDPIAELKFNISVLKINQET